MQMRSVPASYNVWHQNLNFVISPRSNNFLCATAGQCVFPNLPGSQVLHLGERAHWARCHAPQTGSAASPGGRRQRGLLVTPGEPCDTPALGSIKKVHRLNYMNNDYRDLNEVVMKPMWPRSSFSRTKNWLQWNPCSKTWLQSKPGPTLEVSRYTETLPPAARNAAEREELHLRQQLKSQHMVSSNLHTICSVFLPKH